MTDAYVLAKVEAGLDQEVLKKIEKMPRVKHVTPTYGMFDLHVEVSFSTMEELDKLMFQGIRRIPGVKDTVTLIAPKVV